MKKAKLFAKDGTYVRHKCGRVFLIMWEKADSEPAFFPVRIDSSFLFSPLMQQAHRCSTCNEDLHPFKNKEWREA